MEGEDRRGRLGVGGGEQGGVWDGMLIMSIWLEEEDQMWECVGMEHFCNKRGNVEFKVDMMNSVQCRRRYLRHVATTRSTFLRSQRVQLHSQI